MSKFSIALPDIKRDVEDYESNSLEVETIHKAMKCEDHYIRSESSENKGPYHIPLTNLQATDILTKRLEYCEGTLADIEAKYANVFEAAEDQWLPIDDKARDGDMYWVCWNGDMDVCIAWFSDGDRGKCWYLAYSLSHFVNDPDYYRPATIPKAYGADK